MVSRGATPPNPRSYHYSYGETRASRHLESREAREASKATKSHHNPVQSNLASQSTDKRLPSLHPATLES